MNSILITICIVYHYLPPQCYYTPLRPTEYHSYTQLSTDAHRTKNPGAFGAGVFRSVVVSILVVASVEIVVSHELVYLQELQKDVHRNQIRTLVACHVRAFQQTHDQASLLPHHLDQ